MTRPRPLGLWAVALWALCLAMTTGSVTRDPDHAVSRSAVQAPVSIVPSASATDPALLPARIVDEVGVPAITTPLRMPLMVVVLAGLVGLPAVLRLRAPAAGAPKPLRSRRHAIAVRAPPLQFA